MELEKKVEIACDIFREYVEYMMSEGICTDIDDLRDVMNVMLDLLKEEGCYLR